MISRLATLSLLALSLATGPAAAQKITKPQSPEEQGKLFQVPEGFVVELVAQEPLIINPITMAVDEKGWIFISESHTYRYGPSGSPIKPFSNPVVCLKPTADGKYERRMVAEGFEEPVMGLLVKEGKLYCTANNYLFLFDLDKDGKATNKQKILTDKNKAWNPFGMFVLEEGPDGQLYLSVGNHNIDIGGPTNRVSGRGSSGIVLRMKPDGSDMERLVHGLRVPYSFEYDPFGQLWVLSNGEGNPNRFLRVIEGLDYHCYSRGTADNNWLAGKHPLAPPCFELPSGAHTQLMRYYGSAYPPSYQGSLLLDNWGAHGFNGANRAVFRYVPDEKGNITTREMFVGCKDPHFRPSHIDLDPDGNLLIADWYGRDDESDKTGRIWRVRYTGKEVPAVKHDLKSGDWGKVDYQLSALGSPHHLVRAKAIGELLGAGERVAEALGKHAATAAEPMGAANALWVLTRLGKPGTLAQLPHGTKHDDARVRRLAMNLLRRHSLSETARIAKELSGDKDLAVRLEAALGRGEGTPIRDALLEVLTQGAAADPHLRYEAAWHLAKHADAATFGKLLSSEEEALRLAGLIAVDVACYENYPSKAAALEVLAQGLAALSPKGNEADHLLTLVRMNGDKALLPALQKLVMRDDVPVGVTARGLLVLRSRGGDLPPAVLAAAGKRFLLAVEKGAVKVSGPSDQMLLLELLETEGPTDFAIKQVGSYLNAGGPVRQAAHGVARKFGPKAAPLAKTLWPRVLDPKAKTEERVETLTTLARIETEPAPEKWEKLLEDADPALRTEAVRWWRAYRENPKMKDALLKRAPGLVKENGWLKADLIFLLRQLDPDAVNAFNPLPEPTKDGLAEETMEALSKLSPEDQKKRAWLGKQVFDRAGCMRCHTTLTQNTPRAPSLKGIAAAQKAEYLIESVLHPSKVIKTGYETERILTTDGRTIVGLVKEEGGELRVFEAEREFRIKKTEVEERNAQKVSLMPEGQERLISREEFLDLVVYMRTLK